MHQPAAHHSPAKMLADRLMPQAHAEQWLGGVGTGGDQIEADPGLVRGARAGRNQKTLRAAGQRLCSGQRIVAHHLDPGAQLHQIVDQVPGEAVVIVDDQDHGAAFPANRSLARTNPSVMPGSV